MRCRWVRARATLVVVLLVPLLTGGLAAADSTVAALPSSASVTPPAVALVPTPISPGAPAWTVAELDEAPLVPAPYTEPGLGVPGAAYIGTLSSRTQTDSGGPLDILITLAFSNESRLVGLLSNLTDPSSPEYHHFLDASQFDADFGGAPAVYDALVQYVESFGVSSVATFADRLTVAFDATPVEAAELFDTSMGSYVTASGDAYYAPASVPKLPAPLAGYVIDVEGLSNYSEYLTHVAPLASTSVAAQGSASVPSQENSPVAAAAPGGDSEAGSLRPGGTENPFPSTVVSDNGLTNTYDQPVVLNLSGKSGTCDTNVCGDFVEAPDLQVTYNETGLFEEYGYPVNATVAAILWSDPVCTSERSSCAADGYYNHYCSTLPSADSAWDVFLPDVTSYWNYSIPAGEPMPTAYSMPTSGYAYAYPSGSEGYSASCDDGGADIENTLDVDMLGSLAPGANVFQVFGGASTSAALDTDFADILSPSTGVFSDTGGTDTVANVQKLDNVSVITNSWTTSGTLPAAWTSDLEIAAARGITVLAASGDSGTTLEPPAEIADNTFGTVAVSGTTAAINPTTLLRGPPHLATEGAPYDGVGTGEIGWYEPAGTVDGFGSTYGGTGGVGSTASYYRATWFNASADASAVADAVSAGNYRVEPDLAAIANDTPLDLDVGPDSENLTCWVSPACTAVSPIAVGTGSGSSPTIGGTYLIGTSIADQVEGGVVATIDHALYAQHQGWLGYLDPEAYPMGQKQDAGELALASFYDVTTYTDGGGLAPDYEAKAGYSLATGWGALDAGNYTQNTMTFNATFVESGLPAGTSWSVTVTPSVGDANCTVSGSSCTDSATQLSDGTTVVFPGTYGLYSYTIASSNPAYSASAGSFRIDGGTASEAVSFARTTYSVTFTESGLPPGTAWYVNITDGGSYAGTSGSAITFLEPNGTYGYAPGSANRTWAGPAGSFTVAGAPVAGTVTFAPVTFEVTFAEAGLVPGTPWSVTLAGTRETSTVTDLTFDEPNGSYAYAVTEVAGYAVNPESGSITVDGAGALLSATFTVPRITVTPTQGPVGATVTVSGTGFTVATPVLLEFATIPVPASACLLGSLTPNAAGAYSCSFPVPVGAAGTVVTATDAGGTVATGTFTVTTPYLVLTPGQGPMGAPVNVTGHGFTVDAPVGSLVFDGVAISSCPLGGSLTTGRSAGYPGGFSCLFDVPGGTSGATVVATDATGAQAKATFTVTVPTLSLSSGQGPVGATVTAVGHGFSVETPLASLAFDGVPVTSCLSGSLTTGKIAGSPGAFSCTFTVPSGTSGTTVSATDVGGALASATFTVTVPTLSVTPGQGPTGATVVVTGHGFSVDTPVASLVFDGVRVTSCSSGSLTTGQVVGWPGGFSCTVEVPGGTSSAIVTATDVGGASASTGFTVTAPTLSVTPGEGPVGTTVTVVGHGFSVDALLASLVFDGVAITSCVSGSLTTGQVAGWPGGFNCTFVVPGGTSGTTVLATDVSGAQASARFEIT